MWRGWGLLWAKIRRRKLWAITGWSSTMGRGRNMLWVRAGWCRTSWCCECLKIVPKVVPFLVRRTTPWRCWFHNDGVLWCEDVRSVHRTVENRAWNVFRWALRRWRGRCWVNLVTMGSKEILFPLVKNWGGRGVNLIAIIFIIVRLVVLTKDVSIPLVFRALCITCGNIACTC